MKTNVTQRQPVRFDSLCTTIATALAATISVLGAVPLDWETTPSNPVPAAFDRHHGETLEFRCAFAGFGELPFGAGGDVRLWYQTNGMGAAWWSVPASASSNVLSATFPPQADPGADRLSLFFGAPSNAYASAVLRLRHSPGFTPNVLPPPDVTGWEMDLAALRALIPPDVRTAPLELPAEAAARGVTFEREGEYGETYENTAIEIGRGAKAALDAEAVSNAPNGQVLRSVSVAIGAEADATQDNPYTSQAVAIGWSAKAKTQNSVAIGSGSPEVHDLAEPTGNSTVASGAQAVAIGYDAKAKGFRSIAVGRSAKALAENAVQLGTGTNSTPDSLQFGDVTIVKDGKVQGGGVETNAVREIVEGDGFARMKWTEETNGVTRTRWTYHDAETDDDISFTAVVATNSDAEVGATLGGVEIYSKATVDRKLAEAQADVVRTNHVGDVKISGGDVSITSGDVSIGSGDVSINGTLEIKRENGIYLQTHRLGGTSAVVDNTGLTVQSAMASAVYGKESIVVSGRAEGEGGTLVFPLRSGTFALDSDLPPLTNSIPDTAARAVYDVHDLMWDETESILYWHKIRQGHDEYIAVTNIDLTHPTNAVILKAWREANR